MMTEAANAASDYDWRRIKVLKNPDYKQAMELMLSATLPVGTECVPLSQCGNRVLAQELIARENVPAFDRSPYDGYAFRAADTELASVGNPVVLRVLEEIPAGAVSTKKVVEQTASKVFTGSPIPDGADAVMMYERTEFTEHDVTLFSPVKPGENIVRTGEDVQKGAVLAGCGDLIDPGLAGVLAAQGNAVPCVYKIPRVAVFSTGSELVEAKILPEDGKIRNSNRYMLETALKGIGCESVYFGIAGDSVAEISACLNKALSACDAVVITGGVSAGDYDLTPDAMEASGVRILLRGVDMKPGMACAYGVWNRKPICALSGNPASALTNFYVIAAPVLKKLAGCSRYLPREISLVLPSGYQKKSPRTRFLRGRLRLENGAVCMDLPKDQGNAVLSSAIGCDVMAVIPAGSGPIGPGAVVKGFLL